MAYPFSQEMRHPVRVTILMGSSLKEKDDICLCLPKNGVRIMGCFSIETQLISMDYISKMGGGLFEY